VEAVTELLFCPVTYYVKSFHS